MLISPTDAIPKIIHLTYAADRLTDMERDCIARIKRLHPEWTIMEWAEPVDPAPFILSRLWPLCRNGAQRADLIRLEAVYNHGGIYLDVDMDVLQRLDPLLSLGFFVGTEDGRRLTNATFGAPKGHPAIKAMIDVVAAYTQADLNVSADVSTGPGLFSRTLRFRTDVTVVPRSTFYPYNWDEDAPETFHPATFAVHRWSGSWKSAGSKGGWKALRKKLKASFRKRFNAAFDVNKIVLKRQVSRSYAQRVMYPMSGPIITRNIHDLHMCVDGDDMTVTTPLLLNGYYEFEEELFLYRWMKPGDWFVDVGANCGVLSLLAAKMVKPFGRIIAFEPNPRVRALLNKSIALNWFQDRVRVTPHAVGNAFAAMKLFVPQSISGAASLVFDRGSQSNDLMDETIREGQNVDVQVVALDGFLPPALRFRLLKMDVEGFEPEVMEGMSQIIATRRADAIMVEASPEIAGDRWPALNEKIKGIIAAGYSSHKLDRRGALVAVPWEKAGFLENTRNWIFVSKDAHLP
ncbi:MAG: FkbM family methyltransferase [Beijerinckiaceae bacterium]